MKRYFSLVILCTSLAFQLLHAPAVRAETELKDIVATVERSYDSLTDMQASFSQKTFIVSMKREQAGNGTLYIRKNPGTPAMFRFDYVKPKQLIVSNGSSVWFYLPENRQVMVTDVKRMFEAGNGVALNYLTGIGRISRDFTITRANGGRDDRGNFLLELVPKTPSQTLAKLRLTVSADAVERFVKGGKIKGGFPIVSSVVFDSFGTRTTIDFRNVTVNRGLNPSLFTFKAPAGVEVIKQ
jgi:outer membrane lipoprotein carrier protein